MKYLKVELRLGGDTIHPMHEFIVENDGYSTALLLHWNSAEENLSTLIFYVEGDFQNYAYALQSVSSINDYDVTFENGEGMYIHVWQEMEEHDKTIVDAFTQTGMVTLAPIEYRTDRTMCVNLVGTSEALQNAIDLIPEPICVDVVDIGKSAGKILPAHKLTERQMEAVNIAVDVGYYSMPRKATIEDVGDALDCATGTAAEHLRKAQAKIMDTFTDRSHWLS